MHMSANFFHWAVVIPLWIIAVCHAVNLVRSR